MITFLHQKQKILYEILIKLDISAISNDIWRVISEYGYSDIYQCNVCQQWLNHNAFSNAQIKKGNRKCMKCTGVDTGGSTLGRYKFRCGICEEYKPKYMFHNAYDGSKCRMCDNDIHQYKCTACNQEKDGDEFSKSQRRKRNRKCKSCVMLSSV